MSKIFDFVKPGVISGDDVQKVFEVAKENKFALPAVNVVGTDSVNAVLEAAAKVKSPVVVQFSNGGAAFFAAVGSTFVLGVAIGCTGALTDAAFVEDATALAVTP